MATTKLKLRADRKNSFDSTSVYVQVCINSRVKLYPTGFKVNPEQWDEKNQKLKKSWGYRDWETFCKIGRAHV